MSFKLTSLFSVAYKTAYITGGARGIGLGITKALSQNNCNVIIADIDEKEAKVQSQKLNEELQQNIVSYYKTDVTSKQSMEEMIDYTMKTYNSHVDIAIHNAGICESGVNNNSELFEENLWDRSMDVNLKGVFLGCQAVANKCMIPQEKGKIINIASMSAHIVNQPQKQSAYNVSKAGVVMLTKSLALEWAKYPINVNCISPGYTLTELTSQDSLRELRAIWIKNTPMKRMATPDDLVGAVLYLASDASNFCSGMDMLIDGGFTIV